MLRGCTCALGVLVAANGKGPSKAVSGSIKEAIGKITGDVEAQAEGAAEKAAGATHAGNTKNDARQNLKD